MLYLHIVNLAVEMKINSQNRLLTYRYWLAYMMLIRDSRLKTKHSITFIHTCAGNSDTFSDKHKYKITVQTHHKIIKQTMLHNFLDKNKLDYLFINNLVLLYEKSDFNTVSERFFIPSNQTPTHFHEANAIRPPKIFKVDWLF